MNARCTIEQSKILARIAFLWLGAWVTVLAQDAALLEVTPFRNQDLEGYPTLANYVDKDASWTIPGLGTNFVPQGVAWIPDSDLMLVSGYQGVRFKTDWGRSSNWPFMRRITTVTEKLSMVFLVQNGIPVRAAYLAYENGNPMKRHAGGVAVWRRCLPLSPTLDHHYPWLDQSDGNR